MDTKPTDEKKPFFLSTSAKWIAGTIAGVGSGLARFITNVRGEFHENTVKGPEFTSILNEHRSETGRIRADRLANKLTTEEFISKTHHEKNLFAQKVESFSEKLGIISHGPNEWVEGSIQRYRLLSAHTRTPLVFSSISTAVIGFAGTSMFMNSLASRKKLDTIAKGPTHSQDPDHQR